MKLKWISQVLSPDRHVLTPVSRCTEPPPAGAPRAPKPLFDRLRTPGWYVFSCLIFVFYLWTATSSDRPFHPRDTSNEFYNQLTDSLMLGHVYLAAKPSPQLLALPDPYDPWANEKFRLHDASLYRGRYYLYFGIAPAVTLYLPWRVLTGGALSDDLAVALYSMGGYVFSCLLLFLLFDASRIRVPWFLQFAAVACLGLGQVAPIVLRRPRVYEVAVSAAYCFLLAGLYFLARRMVRPNARRWLPALAAMFLGLAAASRPQCALVALIALILYGFYLSGSLGLSGRRWLAGFAIFALPLAVAGSLIAWYNYVRFDNPLEFGIRYQVGVQNLMTDVNTGRPLAARARYILSSFYYLLVCPPSFMPRFPFFELSGGAQPFGDPDFFPKGYFQEPVAGMLLISPLCLAGFTFPFLFWKHKGFQSEVRSILLALSLGGIAMFAAVCSIPSASARYGLDVVPVLLIVGLFISIWFTTHRSSTGMRAGAMALTLSASIWASTVNMALSVNSYGYPLERPHSSVFRSLASFFGAGPDAIMDELDTLRLEATVTFRRARQGTRETLLATGIYERWDLLFVSQDPGDKLVFGYVHSGVCDGQSQPVNLSFDTPHHLTVNYSAAAKAVVVAMDGTKILDYPTTFFPTSRDRVTIGRMRVGRFRLHDFSGQIAVAPAGLVLGFGPARIYTPPPSADSLGPAAELLDIELDGLLAHTAHVTYGHQSAWPSVLPKGVFEITDNRDHFATSFQPVGAPGSPPVTAVEITVIDQARVARYGNVNLIFQDQGYHTLYSSGWLAAGEDRALVGIPPDTQAVRLAFLSNDAGYIRFPQRVRLRAFSNK